MTKPGKQTLLLIIFCVDEANTGQFVALEHLLEKHEIRSSATLGHIPSHSKQLSHFQWTKVQPNQLDSVMAYSFANQEAGGNQANNSCEFAPCVSNSTWKSHWVVKTVDFLRISHAKIKFTKIVNCSDKVEEKIQWIPVQKCKCETAGGHC